MIKRSLFYRPRPRTEDIRKKRWNIAAIMGKALRRTCTVLGAIMLVWIVLSSLVMMTLFRGGDGAARYAALPDKMVVVLKLDRGLTEKAGAPTLTDPFPYRQPTVHQVIAQLDAAARDPRVKGFVLSLKSGGVGLAHIQELRAAVARFRAAGKFATFYTTSFADYGQGLSLYYLASAFDEVWMQPVGMLAITGVGIDLPYARDALSKIGVRPEFFQREEYKGAMENVTESAMPAASREAIGSIVDEYARHMSQAIAAERGLAPAILKTQIDKGLLSGDEALAAKLIDRLDYGDVLMDDLDERVTGQRDGDKSFLIPLERYPVQSGREAGKARVALIQAVGAIVPGASRDGGSAAADDIAGALYEATEDETIQGIVLRIDSPGGSPSASETIRRAVMKAQEKGKKVVVSMGATAASGGYWIAAPADYIVASPATLTGSIGVVMGKFTLSDLWDRLGVNWESISYGANAGIWSSGKPFDERARARMNALIDDTYRQFLTRVAQGRGMSVEEARKVAKGRAWTGAQAKERGLVDELGGQTDALDRLAVMLGRQNREDLNVVLLPRAKRPFERLIEFMEQQASLGVFFTQARAQWNVISGVRGVQAVEPLALFQ